MIGFTFPQIPETPKIEYNINNEETKESYERYLVWKGRIEEWAIWSSAYNKYGLQLLKEIDNYKPSKNDN